MRKLGGSTPGLRQVACDNYHDSQCTNDVVKKVDAGATFSKTQLDATGRNAIKNIGNYDGWLMANYGTELNNGHGLTASYPCSDEGKRNGDLQNLEVSDADAEWLLGRSEPTRK